MTQPTQKNPRIETFKAELTDLKERLSKGRRLGQDLFIAQIKATAIPAKIKMAEATQSERDFGVVQNLMNELRAELGAPAAQNIKKEPQPFDLVKDYLERAKDAARQGKKEEATVLYGSVKEHFASLSPEQKKAALPDCQLIVQLLKK